MTVAIASGLLRQDVLNQLLSETLVLHVFEVRDPPAPGDTTKRVQLSLSHMPLHDDQSLDIGESRLFGSGFGSVDVWDVPENDSIVARCLAGYIVDTIAGDQNPHSWRYPYVRHAFIHKETPCQISL